MAHMNNKGASKQACVVVSIWTQLPKRRPLSLETLLIYGNPKVYYTSEHPYTNRIDPYIVLLKQLDDGFGYSIISSPYAPYSIYLRGTITPKS